MANTFRCFDGNLRLSAFWGSGCPSTNEFQARDIIFGMHVAAVRITDAQKARWINHTDHLLTCEECGVQYSLYCDKDAVGAFSRWSLLAQEIITARHPHHHHKVILDWIEAF